MSPQVVLIAELEDEQGAEAGHRASARRMVRDHVLTAPESALWAALLDAYGGDYEALVGGLDAARRRACSEALFSGAARGQRLDDAVSAHISASVSFALKERWVGEAGERRASLGVGGLLVCAARGQIEAACLPAGGVASQDEHDSAALRREGAALRRGGQPRYGPSQATSPARRLYDDVFAPSWGAVCDGLFDRPQGKRLDAEEERAAAQDALARALLERWRGRTPHYPWWLKSFEESRLVMQREGA